MKVLIIDNHPHNQSTLNARLNKIVEYKLGNFEIDIVPKPSDAILKVKINSYDFIFLDLKLSDEELKRKDTPIFDGIALCEDIKKINSSPIVIIYSMDIKQNKEKLFSSYSDCEAAGADFIISKSELFNFSAVQLNDFMIKQKKIKDGLLLSNRPITYDEDFNTKTLIEVLGRSIISEIIYALIPEMIDDHISVMEPGFSGAFVFIVKSSTNEKNQFNVENVIKISRSRNTLYTELKNAPTPGSYLHSLAVTPSSIEPIMIKEFYCIKIPKVRNAKILADVLALKKTNKEMTSTFNLLLKNLVIEPINEAFSWEYSKGIVSNNYLLTYAAGNEILKNLEIIISSLSILPKKVRNQAIFMREFLIRYYEDSYKFTNDLHKIAYLHGDLHCKNIFYVPNQNPIIIDFGRSTVYPRLFDAAALNVDLIISQLDSQKGKSNDLKNIDSWTKIYLNLYPFEEGNYLVNNNPIITVLNMLSKSLVEEVKDISRIEYAEVLVFQLLRYIRFPNVTFPKKILIVKYLYSLINKFLTKK